ncbi:MAG: hypothetical protein HOP07_05635 [Bacteriovoracaceae bacterium]|nr:hypothetical protein [Bacteriovoracaceae bacterium]
MNGYYRRRSDLPFEEIRPLKINEIEFVSDTGELQIQEDTLYECPICGEEAVTTEDQIYCNNCTWKNTENENGDNDEN